MTSMMTFAGFPNDGRVYLVRPLDALAGFYVCDGDPIYASRIKSTAHSKPSVETECLQLRLGVKLKIVSEGTAPNLGQFDMIKLTKFESERELTAFIDLCTMHAKGDTSLTFEEFFYSINTLFKPLRGQAFINALGLYGELALIDAACRMRPSHDLSRNWQLSGAESKYDYSFKNFNIEAKTTLSQDANVLIKHSQLFNDDENYLVVVHIEKTPNGETLEEIADRLANCKLCFNDFRSQAELSGQLLRVDEKGSKTRYKVRGIKCYYANDINPFEDIQDRVTELCYRFSLLQLEWASLNEILSQAE